MRVGGTSCNAPWYCQYGWAGICSPSGWVETEVKERKNARKGFPVVQRLEWGLTDSVVGVGAFVSVQVTAAPAPLFPGCASGGRADEPDWGGCRVPGRPARPLLRVPKPRGGALQVRPLCPKERGVLVWGTGVRGAVRRGSSCQGPALARLRGAAERAALGSPSVFVSTELRVRRSLAWEGRGAAESHRRLCREGYAQR